MSDALLRTDHGNAGHAAVAVVVGIMTVSRLMELLKEFSPEAEIYVATYCHGCYVPADKVSLSHDGKGTVVIEESGET